jgi:hypothetical protein
MPVIETHIEPTLRDHVFRRVLSTSGSMSSARSMACIPKWYVTKIRFAI